MKYYGTKNGIHGSPLFKLPWKDIATLVAPQFCFAADVERLKQTSNSRVKRMWPLFGTVEVITSIIYFGGIFYWLSYPIDTKNDYRKITTTPWFFISNTVEPHESYRNIGITFAKIFSFTVGDVETKMSTAN